MNFILLFQTLHLILSKLLLIIQMSQQTISNYKAILSKHQNFLKKFKIFPEKSRKGIWAQLLQLPLNHSHFTQLTKPYPLLPQHTINKQVAFIVSAFVKLYPDLSNQWLPGLIHPFVILFKEDSIASFEVALTFLVNWFRPIFSDYPNSSKKIMAFFSKYLKNLQKKVNSLDYPLSSIIQPLLLVCLTDILNKQNTLQVFDYLVAHPFTPELYLTITVTLISKIEDKLCQLNNVQDIALTLRKQKNLNISSIIEQAIDLSIKQQEELSQIYSNILFPLTKIRYPICEFIKPNYQLTNNKLLKNQEQQMNRLNNKYLVLQKQVKNKIRDGQLINSEDLTKKYSDVQGQMRQYLNKLREEHKKKIYLLKQLEDNYKNKIQNQNKESFKNYEKELQTIERRGRLQRQIMMMQQEAKSIRQAEQAMIRRIQDITKMKKEQLQYQNQKLRNQQRNIHY